MNICVIFLNSDVSLCIGQTCACHLVWVDSTNSVFMMSFEIPPGLTDLLQEFTVAVLRERPSDLVTFAANYFKKLNDRKDSETNEKKGGVRFIENEAPENCDEPMQTESEDEDFGKHEC